MTKSECLELFDLARDWLYEARRYVTAHPGSSQHYLCKSLAAINRVLPGDTGQRLILNLTVAHDDVQVDPDVTRGYIDGARHELSILRRRAETAVE